MNNKRTLEHGSQKWHYIDDNKLGLNTIFVFFHMNLLTMRNFKL